MFRLGSKRAKEIQEKEASEQGPPPWKKTIDDALLLFKYVEITTENGKMKGLTMDPDDLEGVIKNQLIKLCYRLCNELDQGNINKYRSYRDEYKEDTFDLWRKGEMFTPVLYLAKASPFGSVAMLKIMIAKGADLKLQASTVGCRILSFFCTSIAKLSLKNYTYYMIRIEGEFLYVKKYLAPKTLGVYDSLVKINKGDKVEFQDWEIEIFQHNNLEKEYNTRILALKNNIPYISSVQYTLPVKTVRNSIIYGAGIALFFSSALIIGVISASAFIVLTPLSQPLRVLKLHKNQARIEFNNIIINSAKRSGLTQGKKNEIIQKLNTDICRQKDCYIIEAQKFVGVQQLDNLPSLPEITPEELTEMNKVVLAHAVQQAQEAATIAREAAQEVMGGGTTTPAATAATAAAAAANAAAVTAVTLAKSAQGKLPETINKVNQSVQQAEQAAAVAVTQATQMNTPTGASTTGAVNTGTATGTNPPCQTETNKWKCWIDRAIDLIDYFDFDEKTLVFTLKQGQELLPFQERVKYIIDNFKSVIDSTPDVNKYEKYEDSYKADKYGLWREGESFTPVLYLAKASPICAKGMLLILLEKTADLTLLAKTKGCFISRKCTSVGKLARKFYFYIYNNGKSRSLVPKTIEMYKSLKELSMGTFKNLNETRTFRNYQNKVLGTSAFNERLTGVSAIMKPWTANAILGGGAVAGTLISLILFPPATATAYVISSTSVMFSSSMALVIGAISAFNMSNKLSLRDKGLLLIKEVNGKISEKQEEALATGAIEQMKLAAPQEIKAEEEEKRAHLVQEAQVAQGVTAATATEFNAGVQRLHNPTVNQGLQPLQINQRVTLTSDQFVPIIDNVLTNTEQVTLSAIQALKGQGIEKEVDKFEKDVKRKIAETRARLNGLPANAVALAPGLGAPAPVGPAPGGPAPGLGGPAPGLGGPAPGLGGPAPGLGGPAPGLGGPAPGDPMLAIANIPRTNTANTANISLAPSRVNIPPIAPLSSPSDKLNLLKVLNESLINTIQQVIEQMAAGNTEFIRRALGYIQLLLIQLQNLVVIFNRLDKRLGNIEKRLGMGRNIQVNSQPDLESLRKQLEEVMRLAPTPPTAPDAKGWFRNPFSRTKGGYSRKLSKTKRKLRRKAPAKTRKRAGHKKASRKK